MGEGGKTEIERVCLKVYFVSHNLCHGHIEGLKCTLTRMAKHPTKILISKLGLCYISSKHNSRLLFMPTLHVINLKYRLMSVLNANIIRWILLTQQ